VINAVSFFEEEDEVISRSELSACREAELLLNHLTAVA
jgi:hypothetical protein